MRIIGLVRRILIERIRDKRTLALLFIAPLIILGLLHFIFNSSTIHPHIGAYQVEPSIVDTFETNNMTVDTYSGNPPDDLKTWMEQEDLDAVVVKQNDKVTLHLLNDNPTLARQIQLIVGQTYQKKATNTVIDDMKARVKDMTESLNKIPFSPTKNFKFDEPKKTDITTQYVYGDKDTTTFDTFSPILIGVFVFLFVFLISGMGFLLERTSGTLERMLMTPIRRFEVVAGYTIGYGIIAVLQTIVIVTFSVYVFHLAGPESIWKVIVINLCVALVALTLGLLMSSFAKSEFQMMQFIPLIIVPQVFLCGIFPLEAMSTWLQAAARITPLYYAGHALTNVMYKQLSLGSTLLDLIVLLAFGVIFLLLNVFALKKYRSI